MSLPTIIELRKLIFNLCFVVAGQWLPKVKIIQRSHYLIKKAGNEVKSVTKGRRYYDHFID